MVDECTDISTVEKISIYCRWEEDGYYIIEIQVPTTVFQLTLLHLIWTPDMANEFDGPLVFVITRSYCIYILIKQLF